MSAKKSVSSRTFQCRCGHLAYWIRYRGWCCYCGNPTTQSGVPKGSKKKGPLTR